MRILCIVAPVVVVLASCRDAAPTPESTPTGQTSSARAVPIGPIAPPGVDLTRSSAILQLGPDELAASAEANRQDARRCPRGASLSARGFASVATPYLDRR